MAATSEETFPAAGRMGLPIFVGLRATEIPDLQVDIAMDDGSTAIVRKVPRAMSGIARSDLENG